MVRVSPSSSPASSFTVAVNVIVAGLLVTTASPKSQVRVVGPVPDVLKVGTVLMPLTT